MVKIESLVNIHAMRTIANYLVTLLITFQNTACDIFPLTVIALQRMFI